MGMVTHTPFDSDMLGEYLAGVQTYWDGLFTYGVPDGVVVNLTKDAIWNRQAPLPEAANPRPAPEGDTVPTPKVAAGKLIDPKTRAYEIDPAEYTPDGSNGTARRPQRH